MPITLAISQKQRLKKSGLYQERRDGGPRFGCARLNAICRRPSDSSMNREQLNSTAGEICNAPVRIACGFTATVLTGADENGHRSPALTTGDCALLSGKAARSIEHLCFPLARQHGGGCAGLLAAIPGAINRKPVTLSRSRASSPRTFSF